MSEQITVTASKIVSGVFVDLTLGNVQGTVQVVLDAPDPYITSTVASSMQVMRRITDIDPMVQDAIDTLTAAVLAWELEDNPPAVKAVK